MFRLSFISFLIGLSLCVLPNVYAQTGATRCDISGNIRDEQGRVISGAIAKVRNIATNQLRETTSLEDGNYSILQLTPGDYELVISASNFKTQTAQLSLKLGIQAKINVTLQIGIEENLSEINANTSIIYTKTENSTNIDDKQINTLPINQRTFLNFILTSPQATIDRLSQIGGISAAAISVAETSNYSFNGQSARLNNITIDGLDNNEPFSGAVRSTFSQEAVQEFQILTNSYSAEFGRATAGVVNIVTKSGTNDFHGTIFSFIRNDKLSTRDVFSSFKPEFKQYQFGSVFSGPIKKDKTFFFTSFERLSVKQSRIVTISDQFVGAGRQQGFPLANGPIPVSVGETKLLARSDINFSPNDSLWIRYNGNFATDGVFQPFGGLLGNTTASTRKLDDNTIAANNTYTNSSLNLVNESRFLYSRREQALSIVDDNAALQIIAPEGAIFFGPSFILPQERTERFYQGVNNLSISRNRNQIKLGVDYLYIDFLNDKTTQPVGPNGMAVFAPIDFRAALGNPNFPTFSALEAFSPTVRSTQQLAFLDFLSSVLPNIIGVSNLSLRNLGLPVAFIQGFGSDQKGINRKVFSLFFQDDIKLKPNLTLKAGLRYDLNLTQYTQSDNNGLISPRLAISYHPKKLDKLNLHASYGVFANAQSLVAILDVEVVKSLRLLATTFPFSVIPYSLPKHRFPVNRETTTLPTGIPFIPQLSQSISLQRNLHDTYSQQINAGLSYALDNKTSMSVNYEYVRGLKNFAPRNINPVIRPIPGDALASLMLGRVDTSQGDLFNFETAFDSYYNGLTISLERRLAKQLNFLVNYTFSKTIDNFSDIVAITQELNNPLDIKNERGLSLQDTRNRFVASTIWNINSKNKFLRDFELSSIITVESGRPYNLLAGVDLNSNGDNGSGDRPLAIGRNAGIAPGFASVDMRLTRNIKLSQRVQFQGNVEVFNLFNRVNISEISRIFPPDMQGKFNLPLQENGRFIATKAQYRGAFAPRQIQIGFKLIF